MSEKVNIKCPFCKKTLTTMKSALAHHCKEKGEYMKKPSVKARAKMDKYKAGWFVRG